MKFPRINPAPFVGLAVAAVVLGAFNSQLIAAHTVLWTDSSAAEVQPLVTAADNKAAAKQPAVSKDPLVVMPNAGIKAPVVYGMTSTADTDVQRALEQGVLHFGNSALPGQTGNAVYVGHSSGQPWAPGNYKFVFTMLHKLEQGDRVQLAYEGELYVYEVTEKIIVDPGDVSVLEQSKTAAATFITCWPVGMNAQRLVVKGKLVSHEARTPATSASAGAPEVQSSLPGNPYSAAQALQERLR